MPQGENRPHRLAPLWGALVEIGFIVFLFYSNLLMGEFNRASGQNKTLLLALRDIFTPANFTIGICSGLIGYVVVEFLRRRI